MSSQNQILNIHLKYSSGESGERQILLKTVEAFKDAEENIHISHEATSVKMICNQLETILKER